MRGFQNGFVRNTEPGGVGFEVLEGGTPAFVEDDDVLTPGLDAIMTISRGRGRRGYKADRSRTKFRAGFAKKVTAVSFKDARISEHQAVKISQGHERKEFCMFEPVEALMLW